MQSTYLFKPWERLNATAYHMTFHHSVPLQINHVIFLHTYLLGVLFLSAMGGWITLTVAAFPFAFYAVFIIRPYLWGLVYAACIAAIAFSAFLLERELESYEFTNNWILCMAGLTIILFSFGCQLLGHYFHEEFVAPPNLCHGFIAAPALEIQSLLVRFRMVDSDFEKSVARCVNDNRCLLQQHNNPLIS